MKFVGQFEKPSKWIPRTRSAYADTGRKGVNSQFGKSRQSVSVEFLEQEFHYPITYEELLHELATRYPE